MGNAGEEERQLDDKCRSVVTTDANMVGALGELHENG